MRKLVNLVLEGLCGALLVGCVMPSQGPRDSNLLFVEASPILVESPERNSVVDSLEPEFVWQATMARHLFLGIFTKPIQVSSSHRVTNPQDCVWAWYSGFNTGRDGNVHFTDGRPVQNGVPNQSGTVTSLRPGTLYYWGLWAWDDQGLRITLSTKEMSFTTP